MIMLPQYRLIIKATKRNDKFWVYDLETKKKTSEPFTSQERADKERIIQIQELMNDKEDKLVAKIQSLESLIEDIMEYASELPHHLYYVYEDIEQIMFDKTKEKK